MKSVEIFNPVKRERLIYEHGVRKYIIELSLTLTLLMLLVLCWSPVTSSAGESRHVNMIAFQAVHAGTEFESILTGNLGELITSMEKDAYVLFSTHTAGVIDRDVINLQTDVLRMTSQNVLANGGLNCRFIFDDESDEDSAFYSISGICDQLVAGANGTNKKQAMIKRTMLSDPSPLFNVWTKFYEDKATGMAFYVDID